MQVLLCKLIDILDNAIPWDSGPKFDRDEEPRYIQRDFRCGDVEQGGRGEAVRGVGEERGSAGAVCSSVSLAGVMTKTVGQL